MQELMGTVQAMNCKHNSRSKLRYLMDRLEPLVTFLERYAKAADTMSQGTPVASLIWGSLRLLLEVTSSATRYFPKLLRLLEDINSQITLYRRYEDLFGTNKTFVVALNNAQQDILAVLNVAITVFQRNGFSLLLRFPWRDYEADFSVYSDNLRRHTKILKDEITFCHRRNVQNYIASHPHVDPITTIGKKLVLQSTLPPGSRLPNQKVLEKKKLVTTWMNSIDPTMELTQYCQRRTEGTGQWLLDHVKLKAWMNTGSDTTLWIHGSSGTGKTFLSARVIQWLLNSQDTDKSQDTDNSQATDNSQDTDNSKTTYFFFDRSDTAKCSLHSLVTTLLSQILIQSSDVDLTLLQAFANAQRYGRVRMSPLDEPKSILKVVASHLSRLNVVIDGLDECEDPTDITMYLKDLGSVTDLHLLVFSRDTPRIRRNLLPCTELKLSEQDTRQDILQFITVSTLRLPFDDDVALHRQVTEVVSRKAAGMFLWTARTVETLELATTPRQMCSLLEQLPGGMEEYYSRILEAISEECSDRRLLAKSVLSCMCIATRPLRLDELQFILAPTLSASQHAEVETPFKAVILELCVGFVAFEDRSGLLRLQHLSARDFLLSRPEFIQEEESQTLLARKCLESILSKEPRHEFLSYSTPHWVDHLLRARYSAELYDLLLQLRRDQGAMNRWFISLLTSGHERCRSMTKLLRSQGRLNAWIKSGSLNITSDFLDWDRPLIRMLLGMSTTNPSALSKESASTLSHFEKLMIVRDLARSLTQNNLLSEGILLFHEEIDSDVSHGSPHDPSPSSWWILNTLGILYDQRGESSRALEMHHQVLTAQEAALGVQGLQTLWTMNEIGRVYRHLGRYDDAERMHERALFSLRQILPEDHHEIIWTINTLARAYSKNGKLTIALDHHLTALETQRRTLGDTSLDVLWTMGDVGKCFRSLGSLDEAESYFRECFEERSKVLGPSHVDTLWTMAKLGTVLGKMDRVAEAKTLLRDAHERQQIVLGSEHSQTKKTELALNSLRR